MSYTQSASILAPALIIYVIDISKSMNDACGGTTKLGLVDAALAATIDDMVRRSMRDGMLQRRYKIALFTYNGTVHDVLHGIHDVADVVQQGLPTLSGSGHSDTVGAFTAVAELVQSHLHEFQESPAPLICHFTDGHFTTGDPTPLVKRMRAMHVADGAVLVQHVYLADNMLKRPVQDWQHWSGVTKRGSLADDYARFLYTLASPMPESYRQNINYYGYHLEPGAALLFQGTQRAMICLSFPVASATDLRAPNRP